MTRVSMAWVHGSEVTYSWFQCILALIQHDMQHNQHVVSGQWLATKYGTGGIIQARNDTVKQFLFTDSEWMFWIDTDMGFAPSTVDRLLEAADPVERPIMGALCWMNRELGPDGMGGWLTDAAPTVFQWHKDVVGSGFRVDRDYPRDQVVQVGGTGSACILIHRSVFDRIEAAYSRTWYSPVQSSIDQGWLSEDLSFCARAAALEIPVHVHTGVSTSHLKQIWLDERFADRLQRLETPS